MPGVNIILQVWKKPLHDGSLAVVAFNRGSSTANITLDWSTLGLPQNDEMVVRNLWARADLGRFKGSYECVGVGPHDSFFLKLTRAA